MDISELSQDVAATGVEEPTPTPKTRVLIVCVTRFKDSELADITDEVASLCVDIEKSFRDECIGNVMDVVLVQNPKKAQVLGALAQLAARCGPEDTVVLLIASFGFTLRLGTRAGGYIALADTVWGGSDREAAASSLSCKELCEALARLPPSQCVLLDVNHRERNAMLKHGGWFSTRTPRLAPAFANTLSKRVGCLVVSSVDSLGWAEAFIKGADANRAALSQLGTTPNKPTHFLRDVLAGVSGGAAGLLTQASLLSPPSLPLPSPPPLPSPTRAPVSSLALCSFLWRCSAARHLRFAAAFSKYTGLSRNRRRSLSAAVHAIRRASTDAVRRFSSVEPDARRGSVAAEGSGGDKVTPAGPRPSRSSYTAPASIPLSEFTACARDIAATQFGVDYDDVMGTRPVLTDVQPSGGVTTPPKCVSLMQYRKLIVPTFSGDWRKCAAVCMFPVPPPPPSAITTLPSTPYSLQLHWEPGAFPSVASLPLCVEVEVRGYTRANKEWRLATTGAIILPSPLAILGASSGGSGSAMDEQVELVNWRAVAAPCIPSHRNVIISGGIVPECEYDVRMRCWGLSGRGEYGDVLPRIFTRKEVILTAAERLGAAYASTGTSSAAEIGMLLGRWKRVPDSPQAACLLLDAIATRLAATEHRRSQSEHLKAVGTAVQCALSDLHAFPYNAPIVGSALSLCIYAARFCKLIGHSQLLMAHQPKLKAACDTAKQLHTSDTRVLVAASTLSSLLM